HAAKESLKLSSFASRNQNVGSLSARRDVAPKLRVEFAQSRDARVRYVCNQLQARCRRNFHHIVSERRVGAYASEAITIRLLRNQYGRQNVRHIVARLLRYVRIDSPEACSARLLYGSVNVALARVVRGHGKFPVAVVAIG